MPWLLKSQTAGVVSASQWYLLVIPVSLLTQSGLSVLQGRLRMADFNWLRLLIPAGYLLGTFSLLWLGRLCVINVVALHLALNLSTLGVTLMSRRQGGDYPGLETAAGVAQQLLCYGANVHVGEA